MVLWRLLTSCSSLLLRFPVCKTSSGKRYNLHLIYLLYLRPEISCSIGLCSELGTRPSQIRLHIQFLFVRPRFCPWTHFSASTSGFFQILPHDRHPCLRLTVPTAKSVVDFHHQVVTHAEHTTQANPQTYFRLRICCKLNKSSLFGLKYGIIIISMRRSVNPYFQEYPFLFTYLRIKINLTNSN